MWYGDPEKGSCRLDGPIEEMGVTDVVPRYMIFYEEPSAGSVRVKLDGHLYKRGFDQIMAWAPLIVSKTLAACGDEETTRAEEGAGDNEGTSMKAHHNHAGFYVKNQPPQASEMEQWRQTLKEVIGYRWKEEDWLRLDLTVWFEVTDIRR